MKVDVCPGCGERHTRNYGKGLEFYEYAGEKKFLQEEYNILKCVSCGLYFKDTILSEEALNEYYNSFDFTSWNPVQSYPTEDIVKDYLLNIPSSSVLDYGCSQGRFLSSFVDKHKCYGYDIDLRALEIAKKKGISTLTDNELQTVNIKFDVIILSDVFEHSLHPTKLLQQLFSLLTTKGVLIVITGYADAKASQYDLPNYWYFRTIQHVCMLGGHYIDYLSEKLNKQVIRQVICSHYKIGLKKRIIYQLRFSLFKLVNSEKRAVVIPLISKLPYLKKIAKWKEQPYFPSSKDHVVLFIKN